MRVHVALFGTYRSRFPETRGRRSLDLPDRATVRDLLERLGIVLDSGSLLAANGKAVGPEHPLQDGERVEVFSPMGGG